VGDYAESAAKERISSSATARAISFNIEDTVTSRAAISQADVVISLIPASFHPLVGKNYGLLEKKHLLRPVMFSDEMKGLDGEARLNGLLFLNECGP